MNGLISSLPARFLVEANSGYILTQLEQLANQSSNPSLINYWKNCRLQEKLTIGSVASQGNRNRVRINHSVCYTDSDSPDSPCNFGSIQAFLTSSTEQIYWVLQRWTSPEYDAEIHQITYASEDGELILIEPKNIICIIGVLMEKDVQVEGRVLRMIIGPPVLQRSIRERCLGSS